MKLIAIFMIFFGATIVVAQTMGDAPASVLKMNNLPNAGQLYLQYCLAGIAPCVTRKAICYGQCCAQGTADDMGYGCSGDIEGIVPYGFRYTAWSCKFYETGKTIHDKASKNYPTKGCHNRR